MLKNVKNFSMISLLFFSSCAVNASYKSISIETPNLIYSYRGEISKKTDRPKDVRVKPYNKKNGTYVDEHYRSKPKKKMDGERLWRGF